MTAKLRTATAMMHSRTIPACLVFVLLWSLGLAVFRGWRAPQKHNYGDLTQKIIRGLDDASKCDCVLLGSSQWLCPSFFCDAAYRGKSEQMDLNTGLQIQLYGRSDYLQSLLQQRAISRDVFNFGLPGAIASDYFLIGKAISERSAQPPLLLVGISVRDFTDNGTFSKANETLASSILTKSECQRNGEDAAVSKATFSPVKFDSCLKDMAAEFNYENAFFRRVVAENTVRSCAAKVRRMERKLSGIESSKFFLPHNSPEAEKTTMAWHLNRARKLYASSSEFVTEQLNYFEKLCQLAEARKLPLIVVIIPLGDTWKNNIDSRWESQCMPQAVHICALHNIPVISCARSDYNDSDFMDWTHLNGEGGKKFFLQMVEQIDGLRRTRKACFSSEFDLERTRALSQSKSSQSGL